MGAASVRTRSASKRSLPAETGVWMVNTDRARTCSRASSNGHAGRDQLARPLHEQERRVALVEVPRGGSDAQRPQRPDAADAQHQLLVQPHLAAAHVQDVGDGSVGLVVEGRVGVQQQQRHTARPGPARPRHGPSARAARRARSAGRPPRPRPAAAAGATRPGPGMRAPGARRRRWTAGSSRGGRTGPTATNGRAMSEAALQWSPASTPRPPE